MGMRIFKKKRITGSMVTALLPLLLISIFLFPGTSFCDETSRGGTFLPMGWDGRGAALADAGTILIRDERSIYWNPANLSFLKSPGMSLGTTKPIPDMDTRYSTFSIAAGILGKRVSPDSTRELNTGSIGLSFSHTGLTLAQGSRWGESALGLSFAVAPNHYNSLGITVKILKNWTDIEDAGASGFSLDMGWTAILTDRLVIAAFGRNVVNQVHYANRTERLDPTWNIAAAYLGFLDIISVEGDIVLKRGSISRYLGGVELNLLDDLLFFRCGMDRRLNEGARTIYTLGFGTIYTFSEISIGFRFDPEDAFGRQTFLSASFRL